MTFGPPTSWLSTLASHQAATRLQVLVVPPALSKQLANFLCVVTAELADRGALEPEAAKT